MDSPILLNAHTLRHTLRRDGRRVDRQIVLRYRLERADATGRHSDATARHIRLESRGGSAT